MRTERLTVLVTPEEKRRLTKLAKQRRTSVGEVVRSAVSSVGTAIALGEPTAEQIAALERAAETALAALQKADEALNRAEAELAKTRAHFAAKPGEVRDAEETPRAMLQRALQKAHRSAR